jgi:subtilisin family serine protease
MTPTEILLGDDYTGVAVCKSDDARWQLPAWEALSDELLPQTHLVKLDEVLVAGDADPGPGWVHDPAVALPGTRLYRRAPPTEVTAAPPSGVPVMEACADPAVQPNAIYCAQGLRVVAERDRAGRRIPFRVAPRYQGIGSEAAPAVAPPLPPPAPAARAGRVIDVGVVDTGIAQDPNINAFLRACITEDSAADGDTPDYDGDGKVESPAGHGTFVAGAIALCEPRVRIHVVRAVDRQGAVSDSDLAAALVRLRERVGDRLDILNLSLGAWTYDDAAPRDVARLLGKLPDHTVVLSAAGNLQSSRVFWPAAMERVIGVGAVIRAGTGWRRAEYSNHGRWVDAVAHDGGVAAGAGQDSTGAQVSAYYMEVGAFDGWASWRGTSFTTPKVAGRIARLMAERDVDAPEAWRQLKAACAPAEPHADFPNAVFVPDV